MRMLSCSVASILQGRSVVAFAGIANPHKFYRTLRDVGCQIQQTVSFPDHYMFKRREIEQLLTQAKKTDSMLVTTTKDYVRIPKDLRVNIVPVPVEVQFNEPDALWRILFP